MSDDASTNGQDGSAPAEASLLRHGNQEGRSAQQVLTFHLAGEEYGLGIRNIQEIRGWTAVTCIPHAPPWVLGVLDLRGSIVPVIDLRRRFGLESAQFGPSTVLIVIRVTGGAVERNFGLVVDAVSEVYDISPSHCRALPELGSEVARSFVDSLATIDGKTVILLDARRLAETLHTGRQPQAAQARPS
jgi:purine-binding chemotaxis protein CheW